MTNLFPTTTKSKTPNDGTLGNHIGDEKDLLKTFACAMSSDEDAMRFER